MSVLRPRVEARAAVRLTVALSAVLAVAGCAAQASPSTTVSPAPTVAPSTSAGPSAPASPSPSAADVPQLLLQVTSEGGFIDPSASIAAVPAVSVYADGRILVPGTPADVSVIPLLAPVTERDLAPAAVAAIRSAVHAARLDVDDGSGGGIAGDTGSTVVDVWVDGARVRHRFGGMGGPPGPLAGSPDPGRDAALALLARLTDPTDAWGATAAPETAFAATAYRVWAAPEDVADGSSVTPSPSSATPSSPASPSSATPSSPASPSVDWPLATDLADFGVPSPVDRGVAGLRVGVVSGPDAARLGPVLASASEGTTFRSGGAIYRLWARPLLPGEGGG